MQLFQRLYGSLLGSPWVYDHIRPLLCGRLDHYETEVYAWLDVGPQDIVVDVGCGTGAALGYLREFEEYHGFDTDARALQHLASRRPGPNVYLHHEELTPAHVAQLRPTKAVLMGFLHHLPDAACRQVLAMLAQGGVRRAITLDTLYVPGRPVNNLFTWLDRGRYGRTAEGYRNLVTGSGFCISREKSTESRNGIVVFHAMCLDKV